MDTGLMALYELSGKPNTGHALEAAVLHHLLRQGASVSYVHTPGHWPHARRMLVSLSAPAVLALPPGIEHHRATTWLLTP